MKIFLDKLLYTIRPLLHDVAEIHLPRDVAP